MSAGQSPTVRGRRLRAELRRLRVERDLTVTGVAEQLDWPPSKLSRMETGQRGIHPSDVRLLLNIYGVSGEEGEVLIQLAREARKRGWWHGYGEAIPDWFEVYVGLEAEATTIRNYASELVPGLLQTADYYREFMRTTPAAGDDAEIDRKITVRMARQERLTGDDAPQLWAVINEAVIRRVVGGAPTMRAQLQHLTEVAEQENVTVQVLPFAVGAHAAMGSSFVLLEFPESTDRGVVYLEHVMGSLHLEKPVEVERYRLMFDHLRVSALSKKDSVALIAAATRDLS